MWRNIVGVWARWRVRSGGRGMKVWVGIKVEEGIEHLPKQEPKKLIVEWVKILNSDGRDHDTYSSRRRRKKFIQKLAALNAKVGGVL
jgi:hypothetical protein